MRHGAARAKHANVRWAFALAALTASVAPACRGDTKSGGTNHPGGTGQTTCPGTGLTICDLKLDTSADHPAAGDAISLEGIVVTTPTMTVSKNSMGVVTIAGFFAQDQASSDALNGQYSGVLVTYKPETLGAQVPALFDVISVDGIYDTYGQPGADPQAQLQAASFTNSGTKGTITPVDIERADLIATGGEKAKAYEGVLVKLSETTITANKVQPNGQQIYGAFQVDNALIVTDPMYTYANPAVGEVLSSLGGVLRLGTSPYESNQYLLTPRFEQDVVPKNAATVVHTIKDIQDPTAPGHPAEGCANLTGSGTDGKCATADLNDVVITAINGYVSSNLRAMWVQDERVADGRFAGVKVVYNVNTNDLSKTFERGMHVNLTGQIIEYRSGTQIQYPMVTRNGTATSDIQPVAVQADEIARTTVAAASPWEGVLVKIENATVTTACLEDSMQRDHGNFIVDGDVYMGTSFQYAYTGQIRPSSVTCLTPEGEPTGACSCSAHSRPRDQRTQGDVFSSIAGVTDFSYGDFQLNPRSDADLVKN